MTSIGLDMDGTISDWATPAIANINKLYALDLTIEDLLMHDTREIIRKEATKKHGGLVSYLPEPSYDDICPSGFFRNLAPYPYMYEAVKKLSEIGEIIIVTKPLGWKSCPQDKVDWLKEYIPDIDYSIIMVGRAEDKGLLSLDYMIDDDPRVIKSLQMETTGIMVKRPWNKKFIKDTHTPAVLRFSDVPNKIKELEGANETKTSQPR